MAKRRIVFDAKKTRTFKNAMVDPDDPNFVILADGRRVSRKGSFPEDHFSANVEE